MRPLPMPVLAAVLVAGAASAQVAAPPPGSTVYKCSGEAGAVVYQEFPCEPGRTLRDLNADPANVSVIPFRQPESAPALPRAASKPPRTRDGSEPRARTVAREKSAGDPAERKHLRVGMTEIEVRTRIGPPDMTSGKSGTGRWSYLPVPGDPSTTTIVHFERGRVTAIDRSVIR